MAAAAYKALHLSKLLRPSLLIGNLRSERGPVQ